MGTFEIKLVLAVEEDLLGLTPPRISEGILKKKIKELLEAEGYSEVTEISVDLVSFNKDSGSADA